VHCLCRLVLTPPRSLGDFHSFDLDGSAGELMRFYGNRCQHYTTENTATTCRVSFDFRVIPASLFRLNPDLNLSVEIETEDQTRTDVDPSRAKRKISEITDDNENEEKAESSSHRVDDEERLSQRTNRFLDDESLKKLALRGAKPLLEGKYYSRMMLPLSSSESMAQSTGIT
jgi:hypothetical protein